MKNMAYPRVDTVIVVFEDGWIPIPPTVSKQEVVNKIRAALARHIP